MENILGFFFVVIINTIIVLGYYIYCLKHKSNEKYRNYAAKTWMMIFCPLIGPLFILLSFLLYKFIMPEDVDLEDVIFSKNKVKVIERPEDKDRDIVAINEALAISDKDNLRNLMMNVIKKDYSNILSEIAKALNSDDSETSHYAASILQEVLNNFRFEVSFKKNKCLIKDENQYDNCLELIEYMNPILKQNVFSLVEQKSMVNILNEIAELLFMNKNEYLRSDILEILSLRNLEIRDYYMAKTWCDRAFELHPDSLASYSAYLKLAFDMGDRETLFKLLDSLKKTDIVLDHETLELVRVFM